MTEMPTKEELIKKAVRGDYSANKEELFEILSHFDKMSTNDTPPHLIAHALPPGVEQAETAICGAPWTAISNIGGEPAMCSLCLDIGLTRDYR